MIEYIKFWLSKDIYEIGVLLAILFGAFLFIWVILPIAVDIADWFKKWQKRKWNGGNDD